MSSALLKMQTVMNLLPDDNKYIVRYMARDLFIFHPSRCLHTHGIIIYSANYIYGFGYK